MICDKCSDVFRGIEGQPPAWRTKHYSTYAELNHSANTGCEVCSIFERVLLEYYAHELNKTIHEARIHHQAYDEEEYWEDCSKTDASSPSDANSSSEIKEAEPSGSSFFVQLDFCDIEPTFAIQHDYHEKGLQGLHFVRYSLMDDLALDGVYPYLDISSLCGKTSFSQWKIVGRELSLKPDLPLAQEWIDDCCKTHSSCAQLSNPVLPTRILDLRTRDNPLDLRLIVVSGQTGQYAALSHCWGTKRPIVLTSKKLEQFQERIFFSDLPPTFQDAVTVARALGLNFLWIDSLCIIQDSRKDWEEQCAMMAEIYKNATVTLAGPAAPDSNTGFLHSRPTICRTTLELPDKITLSHCGINKDYSPLLPEHNSPLAKRGWVLQERLLSCRILYFGSSCMYFECFQNVRFENCHVPIIWDYQSISAATKLRIEQLETDAKRFQYWRQILETYSPMLLTKPTDRLSALSGLASEISKKTNANYLAGIWREDLLRELTWYIPSYAWEHPSPVTPNKDYVAPSWSWAAAKHEFTLEPSPFCISAVGDVDIVKTQVSLAGVDRFGPVQDGFIEVRGKVARAALQNRPDRWVPTRPMLCVLLRDGRHNNVVATYHPDGGYPFDQAGLEICLLYLGHYLTANEELVYVALGIEATGRGQDEYRRVGLAFTESFNEEEFKFPWMFELLPRRKIRIV